MGVDIETIKFSKTELLLQVEDGTYLKITGNDLKFSTYVPDESYEIENMTEFIEKYTEE